MDSIEMRPASAGDVLRLRSGNSIPVMGLGTWKLTDDTSTAVRKAIELGYRMIDTSGDYGTQPGIREALKQTDVPRHQLYIVTKVEETDDAFEAAKRNVGELGLDQVDLLLIHRPPESGAGEELWKGLIRAREEGLTRDIGVSNYSIELIERLIADSGEAPVVNQIEWSPFGHSTKLKRFADDNDIRLEAYSPLTRGERLNDPLLADLAHRHGKTPAQILIRWNLQSGVIPLPKSSTDRHRQDNLDVFDFMLARDEMERLDRANERYSALGELPY